MSIKHLFISFFQFWTLMLSMILKETEGAGRVRIWIWIFKYRANVLCLILINGLQGVLSELCRASKVFVERRLLTSPQELVILPLGFSHQNISGWFLGKPIMWLEEVTEGRPDYHQSFFFSQPFTCRSVSIANSNWEDLETFQVMNISVC